MIHNKNINNNNRKRRNRRRRNKRRSRVYSLSTAPQRYGPGSNVSVINMGKTVDSSSFGRFSLQTLLQENEEFSNKKGFYKFFKIKEIRAVFLPANVAGSFPLGALNMSWNLTAIATSELLKDDSTKFFPIYRTKNIVFKFLPPRTVLDVQTIAPNPPNKFFDFSQYLNCDTVVNFPGWLYVWNPSNVVLHLDFQAVVRFRGNDFHSAPSKTISEPDMYKDKMFLCDPQGNTLSSRVVQNQNMLPTIIEMIHGENLSKEEAMLKENELNVDYPEEYEENSIEVRSFTDSEDEKEVKNQDILDKQRKRPQGSLGNSQSKPLIDQQNNFYNRIPIEKSNEKSKENYNIKYVVDSYNKPIENLIKKDQEKTDKKNSKKKEKKFFEPQIEIHKVSDLIENSKKESKNNV